MQASSTQAPANTGTGAGSAAAGSAGAGGTGAGSAGDVARDLGCLLKHMLGSNREFFQALEASGISLSQLKCLGLLSHADGPVSLGYVSEQIGISLPAVSRGIDGLVQRGEVKRAEDPSDRRSKLVTVTSRGRSTFERLLEIRAEGVKRFVEQLEPQERHALGAAIRPIVERLWL